jgi:hypothetical protein
MASVEQKATADLVIDEARRIKEVLAESMDFDIDRILERARENQHASGRKLIAPPVTAAGRA